MKKKAISKLMAALLVGVLAASTLTACGNSGTSAPASESASQSGGAAESTPAAEEKAESAPAAEDGAAENTVAGIDGFVPFEETVALDIPIYQRPTPNGAADAGNNYWTEWVQKEFGDKYNIKVNYADWVIPRGEENAMYAQWASVQNLPTVCFEYDYPDLTLYQLSLIHI